MKHSKEKENNSNTPKGVTTQELIGEISIYSTNDRSVIESIIKAIENIGTNGAQVPSANK